MSAIQEFSEKDFKFLEEFLNELETQDTASTAKPVYYCIQSMESIGVVNDDYCYGDTEDYKIKYEDNEDAQDCKKMPILYKYIDMGIFLTRKAAMNHIEQNKHHYRYPRIYTKHFWRNPEVKELFEILKRIVKG